MRLTPVKQSYSLTPTAIDLVSEDVQGFMKQLKASKKNILETRLTVEEVLLDYMEKYGEGTEFAYLKNNFLGKAYISIIVEGEPYNPLEQTADDEFGDWTSALLQNADNTPVYSFDRGINEITIRFSRKGLNPIVGMLLGIASAGLVSLLRSVLPEASIQFIMDNILNPFYNTFIGLMTTVEIPLVFLSVVSGIVGIGDSKVFGKIGRKMVLRFITVILFFTTISGIIFSMLFTTLQGDEVKGLSWKVGIELLLDIFPKSLIGPLTEGNIMQVVLLAIVLGVTLVVLGEKTKRIAKLMNEANHIIVYVTGVLCKLMPAFIFVVLLHMIWSGNLHLFINMWQPIAAFVGILVLLFVLMLVTVTSKEQVKAKLLIKKMTPTFLIGIGTASSVAANGESAETMHKKLGIHKRFVDFGQPVGSVVFMPSTAINFMVCAIYMAAYYKVTVSLLWFIIAIVICTFVAIATPPVAGGAIAAYTIIFAQLGIPEEAVVIVVALDILFDFVATAFDGAFLQLELIRQAEGNKMLDYDVLRNE